MVIKDRIAFGSLAGVVSVLPQIALNLISKAIGFSKIYSFTLAGGVFLGKKVLQNIGGILLGSMLWLFTAAFIGVIITYFLYLTGKEYWWLKGVLVTVVFIHLLMYGFLFNMANAKVIPADIATNFSILGENIIFGLGAGYLVSRWSPP